MHIRIVSLVSYIFTCSGLSQEVSRRLPWIDNHSNFPGESTATFKSSGHEVRKFTNSKNPMFLERLTDGAKVMYYFREDKLATVVWTQATGDIGRSCEAICLALERLYGDPSVTDFARLLPDGTYGRYTRLLFRLEPSIAIHVVSQSDRGTEVYLVHEAAEETSQAIKSWQETLRLIPGAKAGAPDASIVDFIALREQGKVSGENSSAYQIESDAEAPRVPGKAILLCFAATAALLVLWIAWRRR